MTTTPAHLATHAVLAHLADGTPRTFRELYDAATADGTHDRADVTAAILFLGYHEYADKGWEVREGKRVEVYVIRGEGRAELEAT